MGTWQQVEIGLQFHAAHASYSLTHHEQDSYDVLLLRRLCVELEVLEDQPERGETANDCMKQPQLGQEAYLMKSTLTSEKASNDPSDMADLEVDCPVDEKGFPARSSCIRAALS